jgi:hypothetical protein
VTAHPGTIEYVDGTTGAVVYTANAADVDDAIRFAAGPDGEPQPVVKIIITAADGRREIRQYGVDGQLLKTTLQLED